MTLIEQLLDKAAYCIEPEDRNDARQKIIQRFNDMEKAVAALRAFRRNVDVSTINNGKRSAAKWEELITEADAALAAADRESEALSVG